MIHEAIRNVHLTGADPVFPTPYRIGEAGAAAIAAAAQAAADFWELRSGERQTVAVDRRRAAAAMRSATYLKIDGADPPPTWDAFTGLYPVGGGPRLPAIDAAGAAWPHDSLPIGRLIID